MLVGGTAGTGKTTLARELAATARLPLVSKDDIKESLGDVLGPVDLAGSRRLGAASYAVMRAVAARSLAAGGSVLLEANFHRAESEPWLRELAAMADARVVICRTTTEENRRRFSARPRRHPVHRDAEILATEWPPDSDFEIDLGGPRLVVDTTDGYEPDLATIVRFVTT